MINLFIKTIVRNNLPLFYFLMSIIASFTVCSVYFIFFAKALENSSYIYLMLLIFALDPLSISYYLFSFSYDYNTLTNMNNLLQIRKYIMSKIVFYIIFILFSNFLFVIISLILDRFYFENILYANLVILTVLPINIFLSIMYFQKVNLFENKFLILTQKPNGYFLTLIQVIFAIIIQFCGYKYILLFTVLVIVLFVMYFNKMTILFKNRITREYLGKR